MSLLVGAIVGAEREARNKAAGLRTNMLVSFGAALFVLIPIEIGVAQDNPDILGRAIAGVISGVGFIGGGTILRDSRVRGLTSAATVWISASLGVAVGCGLWLVGLVGAAVTWVVLRIVKKFEQHL
ncbi:MgtC/SapB family protein [Lyngbya aestuarii]|uniref:MgtC/SapB family protein n=1 Tax=Lyngbya aestuarii TaxID=118322 RepID=UPI00403D9370